MEFVDLTEEELEKYRKISNEVRKLSAYSKDSDEYAERMERLLFKRAGIIKNAANKVEKVKEILAQMKEVKLSLFLLSK